jgi:hypothetical protein
MITYLYCKNCSRGFAASLRNDDDTPQAHRYELLGSDLKRIDDGRQYVGCAYEDCTGSLDDFSWWNDLRAQAEAQGLAWPAEPIYGAKYQTQGTKCQDQIVPSFAGQKRETRG